MKELNREYKLQHFIEKSLKAAYDIFKMDRLSVWLPNDKGFYLSAYIGNSENPEGIDFLSGLEFSKYIKFMKTNRLLISNDVDKDERLNELKDYFVVTGTRSMLDASAVINGKIIAMVCYENISLHNWTNKEISFMRSISEQFVSVYLSIEEKNSQIKLKDSEAKLNRFFNFAPDGTFSKVNVEFTRITGYTAEELNKISYWDLTPEKYATQEEIQLKNLAEKKAYGPYEKEYIRKDGKSIPVLLKGIIIRSSGEDFIWSVVEDLTLRKQKEAEIVKVAKEHRQFIDTANAPIFGIDADGKVNEWNLTTEKITGFTKDEVLGKSLVEKYIIEDYKESIKKVMDDALKGKETGNFEFLLNTKDNHRVMMLLNTSTRRDIDGNIIGVLGIGQDITESDSLRTELNNERLSLVEKVKERTAELSFVNAELAKAARLKDEFLASMSHELRTPLNAILGLSEALQEEIYGKLNEKQINKIQNIEESGRHLLDLINEILDLAKIEAGKIILEYRQISIDELVQSSLRFIKQTAFKKKIKVSTAISSTTETFQADEKRMKQILVNLLSNAVKFTPDGGQIGLDVDVNEENKVISFSVWDTGIGISAENLEKLFQPFVQIDSKLSRQYEGTGLGLALVNNLVNLHNGSITVDSEVDKGSRFTISIPIAEITHLNMSESNVLIMKKDVQENKKGQKLILLGEDNEQNIVTIKDYLEAKQFRVVVARNGKEALEKTQEIKPDLILMDIQMPVMDGLEATKEIRASSNSEISGIPIIALTALAMPGDKEKCINAGANEYMKKPVGLKKLVNAINGLLEISN